MEAEREKREWHRDEVRESWGEGGAVLGRTLQGEDTDRRAQNEESQSRSQGSGRG